MYICVIIIFISQRHKGLNVGVRAIFAASQVVARRRKFSQNSVSYYISYVKKKNTPEAPLKANQISTLSSRLRACTPSPCPLAGCCTACLLPPCPSSADPSRPRCRSRETTPRAHTPTLRHPCPPPCTESDGWTAG